MQTKVFPLLHVPTPELLYFGWFQLKVLQHELGCKNGLLRAKKLEIEVSTFAHDSKLLEGDRLNCLIF